MILAVAAGIATPVLAGSLARGTGWREAIVVVPDLAPWIEVLTTVGSWEIAWRGPPDRSLNGLWRLPPDARVEQCLMRNVGVDLGYIRLAKVTGAAQRRIRPNDQAWEAGGVQALDIRVLDMDRTQQALEARGWRAPADPVRYTAYSTLEVIQWAPSSPDGVRLSFIQRVNPPLVGWDEIKGWSRVANAATTVTDIEATAAFLTGRLGLIQSGSTNALGGDGPNVLGLPWQLVKTIPVDIRGYRGADPAYGAIELISLPGARGRDFSADARPPNLGIAGLRFMVDDLSAALSVVGPAGLPPRSVELPPYGHVMAAVVEAPGGLWIEFTELRRAT